MRMHLSLRTGSAPEAVAPPLYRGNHHTWNNNFLVLLLTTFEFISITISLRRKCKNFKFDCGVLYFRKVKKGEGDEEGWKICVRTEDEKRRILESCQSHTGIEGKTDIIQYTIIVYLYTHILTS